LIIEDHCGNLQPNSNVRHSVSGTYLAAADGPVLLQVYNWKDGEVDSLNVNWIDDIRVRPVDPDFELSPRKISCTQGGSSNLSLTAGPDHGNKTYLVLSCVTGTWPGFSLSGIDVPLNTDDFTWIALSLVNTPLFENFMGLLDAAGEAQARLNAPGGLPPEMMGLALYFDFLVLQNPGGPPVLKSSFPGHVLFVP
jgi:hypothetical protein